MNTSSGNRRLTADKSGYRHYDDDGDGEAQSGRWLISYADLVTTLMVLFLALYALQLAKNRELEIKALARHEVKAGDPATVSTHAPGVPDAARRQLLSLLAPFRTTGRLRFRMPHRAWKSPSTRKFSSTRATRVCCRNRSRCWIRSPSYCATDQRTTSSSRDTRMMCRYRPRSTNRTGSCRRRGPVPWFDFCRQRNRNLTEWPQSAGRINFPLIIGDDAAARAANRRVTILVEY